jgi:hypothetical protein
VEDYYADLYKAFPDANFETLDLFVHVPLSLSLSRSLTRIVTHQPPHPPPPPRRQIGPQGVVQEVLLTGTHKGTHSLASQACINSMLMMMVMVVVDHQGNGRATSRRGARSTVGW